MERNANYALIGLVTIVLFLGLIFLVVWLVRISLIAEHDDYQISFQGPVTGLAVGAQVHFNGIRVGEVTGYDLDPRNPNLVITTVQLDAGTPVRQGLPNPNADPAVDGSIARLEPNILTGVTIIGISPGNPGRPLLMEVWRKMSAAERRRLKYPQIKSRKNAFADLMASGPEMLAEVRDVVRQTRKVLSDQNVQSLTNTLDSVEGVTAELNANRAAIQETRAAILQARVALQSIDQTADEITRLAEDSRGLVNGDAERALADVADTAREIKASAAQVRARVDEITEPTADFARTGLPQITATVVQLQAAAESVQRLTDQINQSPTGLLTRRPAREVEVAR